MLIATIWDAAAAAVAVFEMKLGVFAMNASSIRALTGVSHHCCQVCEAAALLMAAAAVASVADAAVVAVLDARVAVAVLDARAAAAVLDATPRSSELRDMMGKNKEEWEQK